MAIDPIRGTGDLQTEVAGARTSELFEQHGRMIYGLCRALLRDPDDADDATQATFISAYRSLLGGNVVREPAAWLATIARNECGARAQARMREPLPLYDVDIALAASPEDELERKALVGELQQAIAALPEKQREAVVLRDFYGLPYNEVGAALGMSVPAVESLLFRARRSLRVSLKPVAGGALAVPVAVREGIAQALPAFSATGAGTGGAVSGGLGLGLLAKFTGGPLAVKLATGVVALTAAGSMVAIESDRSPGSAERGRASAGSTEIVSASSDVLRAAPVVTPAPAGAFARVDDKRGSGGSEKATGSGKGTAGDQPASSGDGSGPAGRDDGNVTTSGSEGSGGHGSGGPDVGDSDSTAGSPRSSDGEGVVREPAETGGDHSGANPEESSGSGGSGSGSGESDSGSSSSGESGTSSGEPGGGVSGPSVEVPDLPDAPPDPAT